MRCQAFGWRSTLYFLAAYAAIVDGMFLLFSDSWRKEVSAASTLQFPREECR